MLYRRVMHLHSTHFTIFTTNVDRDKETGGGVHATNICLKKEREINTCTCTYCSMLHVHVIIIDTVHVHVFNDNYNYSIALKERGNETLHNYCPVVLLSIM